MVHARGIAESLGLGAVWIKNEFSRLDLPSFKILGASWGTYRALDDRIGGFDEWSTLDDLKRQLGGRFSLAAATDGNHGRAVARMAKLLGLPAAIYVPAGTADARIEGIRSEGASCEVVDGSYEDAVERSAQDASDDCLVISDTSWEGYQDVPRWVIEGYSTIFKEVDEQLPEAPDVVFIQMGVGALGAAAARHFRSRSGGPRMIAVEPDHAACILASMEAGEIVTIPGPHDSIMAGLNCGTPSVVSWPDVSHGYDLYMSVSDRRAEEGMRILADEGIVAGETGAAGLAGLLEVCDGPLKERLGLGSGSKVLLLCTEGATDPAAYERIVGRPPG
ncbi:MAG: diaminopropionate ammonia-lyase [Actinobacteria bacterium]|nr:diaminopropionate ammonia-lyase [Actinomycetota bacterium]